MLMRSGTQAVCCSRSHRWVPWRRRARSAASSGSIYSGVEWGNTDSHRVDLGGVYRYRG